MIEVKNLTKKYRELTVIDNFSHTFHEGKVYGVMGENGAARQLRFHFVWKREDSLDRVVEKLNTFEAVNIGMEDKTLVVR